MANRLQKMDLDNDAVMYPTHQDILDVTVPIGYGAGAFISVTNPNDQSELTVTVPEGVMEGMMFQIQLPAPATNTYEENGRTFASTHGDHTVKIVDSNTGVVKHVLSGHPRTPWTVKFHPKDTNTVASGCLAGQVYVWDVKREQVSYFFITNAMYIPCSTASSLVAFFKHVLTTF